MFSYKYCDSTFKNRLMLLILVLAVFAHLQGLNGDECKPPTNHCNPNPGSVPSLDAHLYSEPNFKGESISVTINGAWGCSDVVPNFAVKSLLSTGSTQVTLHYGKGCVGHVIKQVQGGFNNSNECPGSVFLKINRFGSC